MEFKLEEGGTGTLILDGDMTVQRAGELKTALVEALDKAACLVIDLGNITDADLSCLQLLCSAHRTALKSNKSVSLAENAPQLFWDIVKKAGYSCKDPCCDDKNCLWIGGNSR